MGCIICDGPETVRPATVAPFVAERMYLGDPPEVELAECQECGFAWFTCWPTPDEAERMYLGYRGAAYQRQRQSFEPDYTPEFNESLGCAPLCAPQRARVLDYGGDGRYLDSELRYAYDISGNGTPEGVTLWNGEPVDLVLCCHVLEHVASFGSLLRRLQDLAAVYIEVPAKRPTRAVMHEHINFFTPESLTILTGASFSVVEGVVCGLVPGA